MSGQSTPIVKAIWAQAHDGAGRAVIGRDGAIPWHLPEDLAHFQRLTSGHAVVMGRHTWESLPERARPLPGRINIVVTSHDVLPGAYTANSLPAAIELTWHVERTGDLRADAALWVMGGQRLYQEAMTLADQLVVTEVDLTVEGDAFAPAIDPSQWAVTSETGSQVSRTGVGYRVLTYERSSTQVPFTPAHSA